MGIKKPKKNQAGFTLFEMIIVLVILAIMATLVVPKLMDRPDEARMVKVKHDISAIQSALNLYKLDNYTYPTTDQGIESLVVQTEVEPIPKNWRPVLDVVPKDPWGNPYIYISPGEHGEFDLFTYGADGIDGGEGVNATYGQWSIH